MGQQEMGNFHDLEDDHLADENAAISATLASTEEVIAASEAAGAALEATMADVNSK
jgi:hypothetical protein